jgi:uncharacterized ion transporter superfamily protein YfcC
MICCPNNDSIMHELDEQVYHFSEKVFVVVLIHSESCHFIFVFASSSNLVKLFCHCFG